MTCVRLTNGKKNSRPRVKIQLKYNEVAEFSGTMYIYGDIMKRTPSEEIQYSRFAVSRLRDEKLLHSGAGHVKTNRNEEHAGDILS